MPRDVLFFRFRWGVSIDGFSPAVTIQLPGGEVDPEIRWGCGPRVFGRRRPPSTPLMPQGPGTTCPWLSNLCADDGGKTTVGAIECLGGFGRCAALFLPGGPVVPATAPANLITSWARAPRAQCLPLGAVGDGWARDGFRRGPTPEFPLFPPPSLAPSGVGAR